MVVSLFVFGGSAVSHCLTQKRPLVWLAIPLSVSTLPYCFIVVKCVRRDAAAQDEERVRREMAEFEQELGGAAKAHSTVPHCSLCAHVVFSNVLAWVWTDDLTFFRAVRRCSG